MGISPRRSFRLRLACVTCAFLIAFLAVAARLAYLQAYQHQKWTALAGRMEAEWTTIEAERGLILSRDGRTLAASAHVPSVFINPRAVPAERRDEVAAALAKILKISPDALADLLTRPKYFVWVKRHVSPQESEAVLSSDLPGVGIRDEPSRCYPNGTLLCHVLGGVGADGSGLAGLEAEENTVLSGTAGSALVFKDGLGRTMLAAPLSNPLEAVRADESQIGLGTPPVNGHSLILTIDARIQEIVEQELREACEKFRPECGCAIVLDPWTGDVLAMAGWPTFDPEHVGSAPPAVQQNMAVSTALEPGSTFKPFVCSKALEAGVVTPDTMFDCHQGVYRIGSRTLHDAHGYGRLSVRDIIAFSSNIGMAQVGARLGPTRMYDGLSLFGFGRRTGIELPGESAGLLHPLRQWSRLSVSSIPMGQEIAVSPLQLTAGFCVFANGGWRVRPRIVLGTADSEGRHMLASAPPPAFQRVLDERIARLMCDDLLAGVVERGTARDSAIAGYPMSGKTGTPQLSRPDARGYEPGAYASLFIGIVPRTAPRFVIGVVIKKAAVEHYGGVVAAPAVAHMAERILSMLQVPREPAEEPATKGAVVKADDRRKSFHGALATRGSEE
jgi:cell division protein FtsI (penicillin-binding protein 3)